MARAAGKMGKKDKMANRGTGAAGSTQKNGTSKGRDGKGGSAQKRTYTGTRRRARPKPELARSWSILLFCLGAVFTAMAFVEGASLWLWLHDAVFGLLGLAAYLLGPALLYIAVQVALERPFLRQTGRLLLAATLFCGTVVVFSKLELTGLTFGAAVKLLYQHGQQSPVSGGLLGGVFGGSLLALCGRPAANILLVVLLAAGVMLVAGVTPGDLWELAAGQMDALKEDREARRAEREAAYEAYDEEPEPEALPAAREERGRARRQTRAPAAEEPRRRTKPAQVDIDLGPEPLTETEQTLNGEPAPEDEPLVGPGGTFGMYPPQAPKTLVPPPVLPGMADSTEPDSLTAAEPPQPAPEQAEELFETALPTAGGEPALEEATGQELASLIRKAVDGAQNGAAADPAALAAAGGAASGPQSPFAPLPGAEEAEAYQYPPLELFAPAASNEDAGAEEELKKNADLLVKTLESFGVRTRILDICRGPSVTRYELQPLAGVKISRITSLADDIALNLASGGVRIEAPIPGKPAVGVEVPNRRSTPVGIRSIFESAAYTRSTSPLTLALGKDIAGAAQVADLCRMPHLLIAGSTGSGKSVCVNSIIISFLYNASPEEVKLILIDPKVVELAEYNGIPHLLMPVVTEPRRAAGALGSAVAEMERRYHLFAENNVRDIKTFNRLAETTEELEKLPYIAIIVDELADLMMTAGKEVEDYICRLAQKARAAGMHLIVATQRPSVDVITGLIKANIPSRIAFAVSSQVDSRTILDTGGAEKLLGMGDMLFLPVGAPKPVRVQGTYVRDEEISAVLDFIKKGSTAQYNEEMIAEMEKRASAEKSVEAEEGGGEGHDPMLGQAAEVVIDAGLASTSLLQRRCKLGYARAARIMDEMEQLGIIGPYQGAKPREVLITRQQWIEMSLNSEAGDGQQEF